eukprot:5109209-Pyramimonas_sp.AAC.1
MDTDAIRKAASSLVGTHDFSGFANNTRDGKRRNPIRTISRFDVIEIERGLRVEVRHYAFTFTIALLLGKMSIDEFEAILVHKDRNHAKPGECAYKGAAAIGLYLANVEYPPHDDVTKLIHWPNP